MEKLHSFGCWEGTMQYMTLLFILSLSNNHTGSRMYTHSYTQEISPQICNNITMKPFLLQ